MFSTKYDLQNLVFLREAYFGTFNDVRNVHSLGQFNYYSFTIVSLLVA